MSAISVQSLKKEAKIARKNNNDLKNHAASLNFIANKYNFSSWEQMLDHCVLPNEAEPLTVNQLNSVTYGHLEYIDPEDNTIFLVKNYYLQIKDIQDIVKIIKKEVKKFQFYSNTDNYDTLFYYVKEFMTNYKWLEHHQIQEMIANYLDHRERAINKEEFNDSLQKGIFALFNRWTGTETCSDMREAHRVIYNMALTFVVDGVIQDKLILKWLLDHNNLLALSHVYELRNSVHGYIEKLNNNSNTSDVFDSGLHHHTVNAYLFSNIDKVSDIHFASLKLISRFKPVNESLDKSFEKTILSQGIFKVIKS